jgi:hypothetical protein
MKIAWPLEEDRCEVSELTPDEVFKHNVAEYKWRGWDRIAGLYGCDSRGSAVRCKVPHCYATVKAKCLTERTIKVLKARPIAPHVHIPLKKVYRAVATATLFVLTQLKQERAGRLYQTAHYVQREKWEQNKLEKLVGHHTRLVYEF